MALIKCAECGNEVSDKARACPRCGAPVNPAYDVRDVAAPAYRRPAHVTTGRVVAAILISFFTLGYLVPWSIAFARRHHKQVEIFLVNLLLGWTLIGWVGTLIWSFSSDVEVV
jgi:cytochrome c biogenesis protein CcdA